MIDIRKTQSTLAAKGYDPGPIDGQWGGKTCTALLAHQAQASPMPRCRRAWAPRRVVELPRHGLFRPARRAGPLPALCRAWLLARLGLMNVPSPGGGMKPAGPSRSAMDARSFGKALRRGNTPYGDDDRSTSETARTAPAGLVAREAPGRPSSSCRPDRYKSPTKSGPHWLPRVLGHDQKAKPTAMLAHLPAPADAALARLRLWTRNFQGGL
jgi:hypothetical protein